MDNAIKNRILALLDEHGIMTIAALRPDGWPQATTVISVLDYPRGFGYTDPVTV